MLGQRWGVTDDEVVRSYPCDAFVSAPAIELWRGVTLDATPAQVWPWLRQLRLAPYSYDWLDNLGRRSPRHLSPLPDPVPGDPYSKVAGRFPVGRVLSATPEDHLTAVIMGALMSYMLVAEGARTRLLLKIVLQEKRWYSTAVAVGDWPMARRQLLNLKERAEQG